MDKNCAIARDLMPQVIDNVASDESRAYVEEHIKGCQPCTQVYADMKDDILAAQTAMDEERAVTFKAAMSQLKKTLGWKRLRTAVLAMLLTVVLLVVGVIGYSTLFQTYSNSMALNAYTVSLYQTSTGSVYCVTEFHKNYDGAGPFVNIHSNNDGIMYIDWKSTIIHIEQDHIRQNNPSVDTQMQLMDDGRLLFASDVPVQEIRQGTEKNYTVIFRAGDTIPQMEPAMDAFVHQQEAFWAQVHAASEAMSAEPDVDHKLLFSYPEFLEYWQSEQGEQPQASTAP